MNEAEAAIVRSIYDRYLETGDVRAIIALSKDKGWTTKPRANGKGGKPMSRGPLYHILANPIYAGLMRQGEDVHPGEHQAIVKRNLWDKVQEKRKANTRWSGAKRTPTSPLAGKLFADGDRLTPSHASKGGKRYRYYISHANASPANGKRLTLKADDIERSVVTALDRWIENPKSAALNLVKAKAPLAVLERVQNALESSSKGKPVKPSISDVTRGATVIRRVEITEDTLAITLDVTQLLQSADLHDHLRTTCTITERASIRHCGQERRFLLGDVEHKRGPDPAITSLLARAHRWREAWFDVPNATLAGIVRANNCDQSTVSKSIRLAFLAPDIIDTLLDGAAPVEINAETLKRLSRLPVSWSEQRKLLGFDQRQ